MSETLLVFFLRLGGEEVINAECYLLLTKVGELHSCARGQARAISSLGNEAFLEQANTSPISNTLPSLDSVLVNRRRELTPEMCVVFCPPHICHAWVLLCACAHMYLCVCVCMCGHTCTASPSHTQL